MKVLIISLPRTGSSSLLVKLAKERGLKPIFEPFHNGTNQFRQWVYNKDEDNVIVKTIIHHHYDNLLLVKEFDEIILLSRRNLIECAESYAFFINNQGGSFNSNQEYHYENVSAREFDHSYRTLKEYHTEIEKLSKVLGITITYYEDIFNINSDERLRKYDKKSIKKNKFI